MPHGWDSNRFRMALCSPRPRAGRRRAAAVAPDARSAVKHRPADVVSQPLVVKYEIVNLLRELVTLPLAFE
jgi:hypothetical protein